MRVHLVKKKAIQSFIDNHDKARGPFEKWLLDIKEADWSMPSDVIETFNSADLLGKGSSRVVFNISGNNYRMICSYDFGEKYAHLYINWIGTHDIYTKICRLNKQYFITDY